jgi:hypothetical protein
VALGCPMPPLLIVEDAIHRLQLFTSSWSLVSLLTMVDQAKKKTSLKWEVDVVGGMKTIRQLLKS